MAGFVAYSIVVAPLVETAVMVPLALALRALPGQSDWPRVFALAALAALAHGFDGSAWQVVAAFWPFVVYSAALFAWRARSLNDAYLVTVLIHMLYNATFFAIGLAGFLVAEGMNADAPSRCGRPDPANGRKLRGFPTTIVGLGSPPTVPICHVRRGA